MRDPNRIDTVLEVIEYYWKENPDLRLGQLLLNVIRDPELYFAEDDVLVCKIVGMYERMNGDTEEIRARLERWTGGKILFQGEGVGDEKTEADGGQFFNFTTMAEAAEMPGRTTTEEVTEEATTTTTTKKKKKGATTDGN